MVQQLTKDFTINLLIKSIHVEVTEAMQVDVIWKRGGKRISTEKQRLINEHNHDAKFDDKF